MNLPIPESPALLQVLEPQPVPKVPENAPKVMKRIHILAYQYWRDHKQNIEETAEYVGVSRQAVGRWKKGFGWDEMFRLEDLADPLLSQEVKNMSKEALKALMRAGQLAVGRYVKKMETDEEDYLYVIKNSKQFRDLGEMMIKVRDTLLEIEPKKDPETPAPKAAFVSINIHND